VDPQTGTYAVRASFPNADLSVRPGQFVRVRLNGAWRPGAILVPQRAVMQGQSGKFVYVVTPENKAEIRPVQVGDWHGDEWFITGGLQGGERIVVGGIVKVQPGAALKISPEPVPAKADAASVAGK
jgi:membrane fusion protein (multidrug efflux system)